MNIQLKKFKPENMADDKVSSTDTTANEGYPKEDSGVSGREHTP